MSFGGGKVGHAYHDVTESVENSALELTEEAGTVHAHIHCVHAGIFGCDLLENCKTFGALGASFVQFIF